MSSQTVPTSAVILAAASALLEAGGPEQVTLRSVGAAAGLSRSAAYRHFDDKADLLRALAGKTLAELAEAIRAGAVGRGRAALQGGCSGYLDYAVAHPHHYQLIFGDQPISKPSPELEAAADAGIGALRAMVEQAQQDGELAAGPVRELATILWVLLHGLAHMRITGHLNEPRTVDGTDAGTELLLGLALDALRP